VIHNIQPPPSVAKAQGSKRRMWNQNYSLLNFAWSALIAGAPIFLLLFLSGVMWKAAWIADLTAFATAPVLAALESKAADAGSLDGNLWRDIQTIPDLVDRVLGDYASGRCLVDAQGVRRNGRDEPLKLAVFCAALLLAPTGVAQAPETSLAGVIDIHVHYAPDVVARSQDAIDGARAARDAGMRAILLKNHYAPTAAEAYLVRRSVPGIEVFGGIALNLSVGGMNPAAVERMAQISGGYGRMVWMDSFDSEAQVRMEGSNRPFVAVSKGGELLPESKAVIAMISKYHLTMGTGHNTAEEALMLVREAKRQGVAGVVVTHAMIAPIHMNVAQMQQAAAMGAYIEFVYNGTVGKFKEFELADYAKAIRAIGPEHCILASDLGQAENPVPTVGLMKFLEGMKQLGFTQDELDAMTKTNPAQLLGLK
jgi:hypothetical protein